MTHDANAAARERAREVDGKFGAQVHSPAEVTLPSPQVEGSFLFPPSRWDSVEQFVQFWKETPLSDETLSNFVQSYATARDIWRDNEMARWADEFGHSSMAIDFTAKMNRPKSEYRAFYQENRDKHVAKINAEYPTRIPPAHARDIARAGQMWYCMVGFTTEEEKQILSTQMGAEVAWEWLGRYKLDRILPDAFYASDSISQRLDEVNENILKVLYKN